MCISQDMLLISGNVLYDVFSLRRLLVGKEEVIGELFVVSCDIRRKFIIPKFLNLME